MMVDAGDADTSILGYTHRYTDALKPVRQIFTTNSNTTLATMEIVTTKRGPMFFADTAVNPSPTVEDLVNTALMAAQTQTTEILSQFPTKAAKEPASPPKATEAEEIPLF